MFGKKLVIMISMVCFLGFWSFNALAEGFPERPVRWFITHAPGGGTDQWSRTVAQAMEADLKQRIITNNMVGANGANAVLHVWGAPHDGYSWVSANDSTPGLPVLTGLKETAKNWSFYIAGGSPTIICANKNSGISDIQALIEKARNSPGSITIASSTGSVFSIQSNVLEKSCSLPIKQIPIAGSRPAIISCVSGETDLVIDAVAEVVDFISSGDLIPLAMVHDYSYAVNGDDIKAVTGFLPEYSRFTALRQWQGFMIPENVPQDVKQIITDTFIATINSKTIEKYAEQRHGRLYKMYGEDAREFAIESERLISQILLDLGLAQHTPEAVGLSLFP